ncbi:MAG: ABC transporter permease [Methylocystaceae bacterium]|nr:ABC transporter permease [Methylocystaceae bacterium]
MAYILLPLFFVFWLSVFKQEIPSFPPDGYSLRWFSALAEYREFASGFILSLQVGVIATFVGLVLGLPAALVIVRSQINGRGLLNSLLLAPMVVPGVVLGTALYVFQIETEIATGLPVMGSFLGLVIAHSLIVVPWTVRLICANLVGIDRTIEEAAYNLGAGPITTFFKITLPMIRPGLVAATLFGFVASFGNLEMSLFLVGPGRTTLPIAILQYLEWKIDPTVAAASVLQIALIALALLITDHYVKLSRVV